MPLTDYQISNSEIPYEDADSITQSQMLDLLVY